MPICAPRQDLRQGETASAPRVLDRSSFPELDRLSFMCPLTQTLSSWIHTLEKAHPMTPRGHQQDRASQLDAEKVA